MIPKWIAALINEVPVFISGDGEASRNFCYIDNTIQANLLAAVVCIERTIYQAYNVGIGECISLNQIYLCL